MNARAWTLFGALLGLWACERPDALTPAQAKAMLARKK